MNRLYIIIGIAALALPVSAQKYRVAKVERTRIVIDSTYDAPLSKRTARIFEPYRAKVDSVMSPVVGKAARHMNAQRPEGLLSNLLPDILLWAAPRYGEHPDFAVYNMGGIRAAIAEGDVTYGDVLSVAPFENKICFLTLTGDKVMQLFREMSTVLGEALSHGVRLVITKDGTLKEATLNGEPIDPGRTYRVATIDFLAQGNDRLTAFKSGTDLNSPQEAENNTRFIIMDYFREKLAQGEAVDSRLEGRITIVDQ